MFKIYRINPLSDSSPSSIILSVLVVAGPPGPQGLPGKTGEKGDPVWIKYAKDAAGTDMSDTPSDDRQFLGVYVGREASADPLDYRWRKFVGKSLVSADVSGLTVTITWDDATTTQISLDPAACEVVRVQNGALVIRTDDKDIPTNILVISNDSGIVVTEVSPGIVSISLAAR